MKLGKIMNIGNYKIKNTALQDGLFNRIENGRVVFVFPVGIINLNPIGMTLKDSRQSG